MADLKDRINGIKQYFRGMKVENLDGEDIVYVIVQFPPRWIVDNEIAKKYGVGISERGNDYYFYTDINTGFDAVFDAIEYNIEKMLAAQERAELLKGKVEELKQLFADESVSLESLRTLDFCYKGKKKKNEQKTEITEEKNTENE